MNAMIQSIINGEGNKTSKIEKLILLGVSRVEIANLLTNGYSGFISKIYAKMKAEGRLNLAAEIGFIPTAFNRKFGVEFEAYGVEKIELKNKLVAAGIVCEIEGYNHNTRNHWKIVSDGSIQGEKAFELVSPILNGIEGLSQVKIVCQVLNQCGAKVNKTCGTHVHFDGAGMALSQWKNVYKNYSNLESVIDSFQPVSRRADNNYYCKGFQNISEFETKISNASSLRAIETVFGGSRYFKINPLSHDRHNTIEFRQHAGTVEFEKISNWILFLHNLVEYSKQNATGNDFESLKKFNQPEILTYIKKRITKFAA